MNVIEPHQIETFEATPANNLLKDVWGSPVQWGSLTVFLPPDYSCLNKHGCIMQQYYH